MNGDEARVWGSAVAAVRLGWVCAAALFEISGKGSLLWLGNDPYPPDFLNSVREAGATMCAEDDLTSVVAALTASLNSADDDEQRADIYVERAHRYMLADDVTNQVRDLLDALDLTKDKKKLVHIKCMISLAFAGRHERKERCFFGRWPLSMKIHQTPKGSTRWGWSVIYAALPIPLSGRSARHCDWSQTVGSPSAR